MRNQIAQIMTKINIKRTNISKRKRIQKHILSKVRSMYQYEKRNRKLKIPLKTVRVLVQKKNNRKRRRKKLKPMKVSWKNFVPKKDELVPGDEELMISRNHFELMMELIR